MESLSWDCVRDRIRELGRDRKVSGGKGARRMTRGGILRAELATLLPFFLDRFSPQAKREILALGIA